MYVTLLPVILAAGLLAALATGALPPGQGALGLVLLLCPGADRFLPLLRELLGRRAAPAGMPVVDEDDALEHAFWAFDAERKRSGDERLLWKGYMRAAFHGQLGLPPAPTPGAPVLVGATDALLAADDANGKSAGNIDLILVAHDSVGKLLDYGSLEVQGVYITGNLRSPFEYYLENPTARADMDWTRPSSS